jgi:hypothetical protein
MIVDGVSAKDLPRPQQKWFLHPNRTYDQRVSLLREFALECHQSRLQIAERDLAIFCSSNMIHGEFRNELGYQITVVDPHRLSPATRMPFLAGHFWQRTSRGVVRNAPEDEYCFYPGMWWSTSAPPLFGFDTSLQQPLPNMLPAAHIGSDMDFAMDNVDFAMDNVDFPMDNVDLNMDNVDLNMDNVDLAMGNVDFDRGLFADVDFNVDPVADTGADIDLSATTQQPSPPQDVAGPTTPQGYVAASSSASPFASQSPSHTPQGVSEQQQDAEPVDNSWDNLELVKQWLQAPSSIAQEVGAAW